MYNTVDLILLDWMLPGLSGLEVCKKIREKNQTVPIIFLTAKDTIQETIEGLKAGANDYIKKPFSFEELLERISKLSIAPSSFSARVCKRVISFLALSNCVWKLFF